MTQFKGFLDRLRENLELLDEQIATARVMSKKKGKDTNTLQWTKTLRDLIELRNTTLDKIKAHLLGRDETGVTSEPANQYEDGSNSMVVFERYFKRQLSPWTEDDLKLKCENCGVEGEDVETCVFEHSYPKSDEKVDLCPKCWEKRTDEDSDEEENDSDKTKTNSAESQSVSSELGEIDLSTPKKCRELIDRIKALQAAGRIESGIATTLIQTINNTLTAHRLQEKK